MKDELGGQIMKTFVGFRAKTYSYTIMMNIKKQKRKKSASKKKS